MSNYLQKYNKQDLVRILTNVFDDMTVINANRYLTSIESDLPPTKTDKLHRRIEVLEMEVDNINRRLDHIKSTELQNDSRQFMSKIEDSKIV